MLMLLVYQKKLLHNAISDCIMQNGVIAVTKNRSVIKKIAEFLDKASTTSSKI